MVCTDYVTKWEEAKSLPNAINQEMVDFLYEEIFIHFDVPREIVTNQGIYFTSKLIQSITKKFKIKHQMSTP